MAKLVDLEKLSTLETEAELLDARIKAKEVELEAITKECNTLRDLTNKEVAQQRQKCDIECQEKATKVDNLLKDAEEKLATADTREKESLIIEKYIKELNAKAKAFEDTKKEVETIKISCLEREKKADLIIGQYNKKIEELNAKK